MFNNSQEWLMKELQNFSTSYTIPNDFSSVSNLKSRIKNTHINFLSCKPMQDQYIAEQGDRYESQHRCDDGSCSIVLRIDIN